MWDKYSLQLHKSNSHSSYVIPKYNQTLFKKPFLLHPDLDSIYAHRKLCWSHDDYSYAQLNILYNCKSHAIKTSLINVETNLVTYTIDIKKQHIQSLLFFPLSPKTME